MLQNAQGPVLKFVTFQVSLYQLAPVGFLSACAHAFQEVRYGSSLFSVSAQIALDAIFFLRWHAAPVFVQLLQEFMNHISQLLGFCLLTLR
eukprot:COSAG01_NODE_19914_length_982_cov_1.319366_2_plen_90_part_01